MQVALQDARLTQAFWSLFGGVRGHVIAEKQRDVDGGRC
jgi:hypothetical protein